MKALSTAAVALMMLCAGASDRSIAHGEITFDNQTSINGEMHVDGVFRCRAAVEQRCSAQVETGVHMVEFEFDDGDVVRTPPITIAAGEARVVPVREVSLREFLKR